MTLQEAINETEQKLLNTKKLLQTKINDLTDRVHDITMDEYKEQLFTILTEQGQYAKYLEEQTEKLKSNQ